SLAASPLSAPPAAVSPETELCKLARAGPFLAPFPPTRFPPRLTSKLWYACSHGGRMSRMKFSELEGKEVLSQDGRELGEVSDVTFDPSGWRIDSLVVKLERDLLESFHMKRPLFGTQTIQIATGHVSGVGDKVILRKTLMELTALARRA